VEECMMIEPTETESKETLDEFIEAMIHIAKEAEENPEIVQEAPHTTVVKRLDETKAARKPVLRYRKREAQKQ
ncbi:MAG: aminomethyl-transferring glycine dehydrogenase subunit GcvPB, partial [Caldibacillus debilis]